MTFEKILEKIKSGQEFIPFKYNGVRGDMFWGYPKRQEKEDKCWTIHLGSYNDGPFVKAYRTTDELKKEDFEKWSNKILKG